MKRPTTLSMNAAQVVLAGGEPQRAALACGGEIITYGALVDAVGRAAAAWQARGLAKGERVAIKLADGIPWVVAYLGAIWAGGVAVGVNPQIAPDDWNYILEEGDFRFVLVPEGETTSAPERRVALGSWQDAVARSTFVGPASMAPDDACFWCHSSGSSGRPKAVMHAHRFATQVERVAVDLLGIGPRDRLYASSKLFFAYPLGNALFAGLKAGATVILDPQWPTPASVAQTIAAQCPTVLFSVPALYRNLLKTGLAKGAAGTLRVCVSAGEALPPSLREAWHKATGITIKNGFGASETLSLVLFNDGHGDVLAPTPGAQVEAFHPETPEGPTRVRIGGPMVALGYWHRPEAEAEHFRDGAFVPGDLFVPVDGGGWRFAGREDSLVKINGRWVDLVALEERLTLTCFGIREGAVIAAPDADGVAAIAFYYAPREEVESCAESCLERFTTSLPHFQRPRWMRAVPALPRTPTGKLLRRKLLEMHAAQQAEATGGER